MALNFAYCHNFITFYTQTLQILIIGNGKTIRHNSICPDALRDILGDKLTAFAPHTSGIQFFKKEKNCSLEIIKQMFDVAALFDIENTPIEEWKNAVIDQVLSNKLNKLKKSNPEAFFYWWQVDKLLAESLQTSYYNSSNR